MSTLNYDFQGTSAPRVFVRSSGEAITGPVATPGSARPTTAGPGGLLTAITR